MVSAWAGCLGMSRQNSPKQLDCMGWGGVQQDVRTLHPTLAIAPHLARILPEEQTSCPSRGDAPPRSGERG